MSYGHLFRIKIVLPIIAIAMVSLFIAVPMVNKALDNQINKTAQQAQKNAQSLLKKSNKTLTLNNIVYEGKVPAKNGHITYKIKALQLKNSTDKNASITLEKPMGTMTTPNGITTTFTAQSGLYNPQTNILHFIGNVNATSTQGTTLSSQKIMVNFSTNTINSIGTTTINRNTTTLSGQGAIITDDNVFQMTGKSRLITHQN